MRKLIFATNNVNKVDEIKSVVGNKFNVVSLKEAGIDIDIPEPFNTLQENASEKSWTIFRLVNEDCFSEDTGLEVDALNGEPGVMSARYAGAGKSSSKNVEKVLAHLKNKTNRRARFRTIISLIFQGVEYFFEGICQGEITHLPKGESGFGYDSIFIPAGDHRTFAEMTLQEKKQV